jgi:DNA-binding MarR family transcriptional regulator
MSFNKQKIIREYSPVLGYLGFTPTEILLLGLIASTEEQKTGTPGWWSNARLAYQIGLTATSTVTETVRKAEEYGFLTQTPHPTYGTMQRRVLVGALLAYKEQLDRLNDEFTMHQQVAAPTQDQLDRWNEWTEDLRADGWFEYVDTVEGCKFFRRHFGHAVRMRVRFDRHEKGSNDQPDEEVNYV